MNDQQLDDLVRGSVPRESLEARERARLRLRAAIAREEVAPIRRRRRVLGLVAAAVVAIVGILVLQIVLPPGSGGPRLSAADEVRKLGRLSADQELLNPGPDGYIYSHYLELRPQSYGGERNQYIFTVKADVEFWLGNDRSGGRDTTIEQVGFVSPLDRENWIKAGSPTPPAVGPTEPERYGPGELAVYAVDQLPTDPEALRNAIEHGDVIGTAPGDVNLLKTIGTLLSQENLSPALRQALFAVAATIPSVTVQYDVKDYAGRPAVAVTATDESGDSKLFFDQSSAQLFGTSVDYPAADGRPAFTEWRAYLDSGIVSSIGERP
jgi:hypothetical protein